MLLKQTVREIRCKYSKIAFVKFNETLRFKMVFSSSGSTLSGAKFEPFRDHNYGLRRFCSVKPTYSDQETHKLTNHDKKNFSS